MAAMQTLGLATPQQATDGLFKRLFWPTITNQYDVDLVGQQGFWVCVVVAVLSVVLLLVSGNFLLAVLVGVTYVLGGSGVRERSIAAAVLIFCCYLVDRLTSVQMMYLGLGGSNPLVGLVALMLLFANVRGTVLSRRWQASGTSLEVAELPERSTGSFLDRVANAMPAAVWPVGKYFFFPFAGLLLALTVVSMSLLPTAAKRRHVQPDSQIGVTAPPR